MQCPGQRLQRRDLVLAVRAVEEHVGGEQHQPVVLGVEEQICRRAFVEADIERGVVRFLACNREHRGRRVDATHLVPGAGQGEGDAAGAGANFEHRVIRAPGERLPEADVVIAVCVDEVVVGGIDRVAVRHSRKRRGVSGSGRYQRSGGHGDRVTDELARVSAGLKRKQPLRE